jgi:hypothetical protein
MPKRRIWILSISNGENPYPKKRGGEDGIREWLKKVMVEPNEFYG